MAGHSKFANIKHRKGAQDQKRASLFTKLSREIIVATKAGGDNPEFNPRLRLALSVARTASMTKDKIEAAIKKGAGGSDSDDYESIRYCGSLPGGLAFMITALTDNNRRTVSDIRAIFGKAGGSLGETKSMDFMFEHVGLVTIDSDEDDDTIFEIAIEAGADDMTDDGDIITSIENLNAVAEKLEKHSKIESSRLFYKPTSYIEINDEEKAQNIVNFVEKLEDNDDVQYVDGNFNIADEILDKLT